MWGLLAAGAYVLCVLAALLLPRRLVSVGTLATAVTGAVVVPLISLAAHANYQSEVGVIQRSGGLLLRTGTGYLPNPHGVSDYDPYLPAMSLYGLPHQLLDGRGHSGVGGNVLRVLGDARVWLAAVFFSCLLISWRLLRVEAGARWLGKDLRAPFALLASPVVALPLCVSGVDLPIAGFSCLALALAARGKHGALVGAVSVGACALKWTAWPLLPVAVVLVAMRRGLRQAAACAVTGVLWAAVMIVPAALRDPEAMLDQVGRFPLGLAKVHTPAVSPLLGHGLSQLGVPGQVTNLGLLLLSAAAVTWWTLRRPPRTAVQAANRLAVGLSAMFLLAPASRFGYFLLPVVLWSLTHMAAGSVQLPRLPQLLRPRPTRWTADGEEVRPSAWRPALAPAATETATIGFAAVDLTGPKTLTGPRVD
jgi:phosphatidylinositol alpha-1,6-mannosyltransferase